MENCIFCKIIEGKIPCAKIYEDDLVFSFLDINPRTYGHALVVPKKHCETMLDLPDSQIKDFFSGLKKVAQRIESTLSPDGYNILSNNKPSAGQVVPHLHFHIIPRNNGDGADIPWDTKKYADGEMEEYRKRITGE